eukprot:m.341916 g.341916  ORF g.341916 m.341916 type:complete len:1772 (+) comp20674_c0_seq1:408-5723(+)
MAARASHPSHSKRKPQTNSAMKAVSTDKGWQRPIVNILRHFGADGEVPRMNTKGSVSKQMDSVIRKEVYRIQGTVPSSNFVQFPKSFSQSLGLIGQHFYLIFKPAVQKPFVIHMDLGTDGGLVVRISISNLFKEFKATSTWLQFPFSHKEPRWMILHFNLDAIVSKFTSRKFRYLKGLQLCGNLRLRNVFTSDVYFPDACALPRDMKLFVAKDSKWEDKYDFIHFPLQQEAQSNPYELRAEKTPVHTQGTQNPAQNEDVSQIKPTQPGVKFNDKIPVQRPSTVHTVRPTHGEIMEIDKRLQRPGSHMVMRHVNRHSLVSKEITPGDSLPAVGLSLAAQQTKTNNDDVGHDSGNEMEERMSSLTVDQPNTESKETEKPEDPHLDPDPIMELAHVVGFTMSTSKSVLWVDDGKEIVFASNKIIVIMNVHTRSQRFLLGHNQKVAALAIDGSGSLLASAETGKTANVRIWNVALGTCLCLLGHKYAINSLSFSFQGRLLVTAATDTHNKNRVILWNMSKVHRHGQVRMVAQAFTDAVVRDIKIAEHDANKIVSCGKDNIRLWRMKNGSLRSTPINLSNFHEANMEFTDIGFQQQEQETLAYVSSTSGDLFQFNCSTLRLQAVYHLHDGPINTIFVSNAFCLTGGSDKQLRAWPLNFSEPFLEAEHEGGVTRLDVTRDGAHIIVGTSVGNLGTLDVMSRDYTTVLRSHTRNIAHVAVDHTHSRIASIAEDETIRIWDTEKYLEQFEFTAPGDCPSSVAFHPDGISIVVGFQSGSIRVFVIESTELQCTHKQHTNKVASLLYDQDGERLYSAGSDGILCMYDVLQGYMPVRMISIMEPGIVVMRLSPDFKHLIYTGPTKRLLTVSDPTTLEEINRIKLDIRGNAFVSCIEYNPDCTELFVGSTDARVVVYKTTDGRKCREIQRAHPGTVFTCAVGAPFLATSGDDHAIKIWDLNLKAKPSHQLFTGHHGPILSCQFIQKNQTLISSASDSFFVWSLQKGATVTYGVATEGEVSEAQTPSHMIHSQENLSSRNTNQLEDGDDTNEHPNQKQKPVKTPSTLLNIALGIAPTTADLEAEIDGATYRKQDKSETEMNAPRHEAEEQSNYESVATYESNSVRLKMDPPVSLMHYFPMESPPLADERFVPVGELGGLRLHATIGYNQRARRNTIWDPHTGLFVYSSGPIVIVDDLATREQSHLLHHVEEISTMALQSNGRLLASASGPSKITDNMAQIVLWDVSNLVCVQEFVYHVGEIGCLAFSRDDKLLISIGNYQDCAIAIWSVETGTLVAASQCDWPINAVRWDPTSNSEFVTAGENGQIHFWMLTGEENVVLNVHSAEVPVDLANCSFTCLTYDDNLLYAGNIEGTISMWNTQDNTCMSSWPAEPCEITNIIAQGSLLITTSTCFIRKWRKKGDALEEIHLEDEMSLDGNITHICFDSSFQLGTVASTSGTIWCVNFKGKSVTRLVAGHIDQITDVAFSNDDRFMVSSSLDGTVRVWSIEGLEQIMLFQLADNLRNSCASNCVAISKDGKHCASGFADGNIRIFDLNRVDLEAKFKPFSTGVTRVMYSPDGQLVMSANVDGVIVLSSTTSGSTFRVLKDHKQTITCLDLLERSASESQDMWLACSLDRRISVWKTDWGDNFKLVDWVTMPAPEFEATPQHPIEPPVLARFLPNDPDTILISSFGIEPQILFYSPSQHSVQRTIALPTWALTLDVALEKRLIVVGFSGRVLRLYDFDHATFQDFVGHSNSCTLVRFNPSKRMLMSAGHSDICLWEVVA